MPGLTFEETSLKIEQLAHKVFEAAGMDLVALKVGGHKNDVIIQVIADKSSGGINIRECAILNKALVAAIEQESFLPSENFSLELSSPGLDRPLVTRKDFMRVVGKELHFWLHEVVERKIEVEGVLVEVTESTLIIVRNDKVHSKIILPLASIIKGMLVL